MSQQFQVGDTVELKSGGPLMTVREIDANVVRCVWFDENKQTYGGFPPQTLRKVEQMPS